MRLYALPLTLASRLERGAVHPLAHIARVLGLDLHDLTLLEHDSLSLPSQHSRQPAPRPNSENSGPDDARSSFDVASGDGCVLVTWPSDGRLERSLKAAVDAGCSVTTTIWEDGGPLAAQFHHILHSAPEELRTGARHPRIFGSLALPLRAGLHLLPSLESTVIACGRAVLEMEGLLGLPSQVRLHVALRRRMSSAVDSMLPLGMQALH